MEKLLIANQTSNLDSLRRKNLTSYWKKFKEEMLKASMKYLLKYQKQENLTIYFFDYATQSINKTIEKWTKGCIFLFPK